MRIGVLTSGGDSPGMNAAIRAVVRHALSYDFEVLGIHHGYNGLFSESIQPLTSRSVANILQRGGTILGSGRCPQFREAKARQDAAQVLHRRGVDALVVIGGDGSYRGMKALHEETGIRVVGMPGTIDNDVAGTTHSIGFDTAVNTALEAIDRIRDTAFSQDRLFFIEVMGRHCGAIAASVALAGGAEAVVIPEEKTDIDAIAATIRRSVRLGKYSCMVIISEGDAAGDAQAIASQVCAQLSNRVQKRVVVLGHIQRGGTPSAADRILAGRLGHVAIQALADGVDPCVVGMHCGEPSITSLKEAFQGDGTQDYQLQIVKDLAGLR